jgi:hypothetical protein
VVGATSYAEATPLNLNALETRALQLVRGAAKIALALKDTGSPAPLDYRIEK